MNKQWSLDSVATALGYHRGDGRVHIEFIHFMQSNFGPNNKQGIFEIGCGPGVIAQSMKEYYHKYVGVDINDTCLSFCQNFSNDSVKFYKQDVEHEWSYEIKQEIKNCNICYIDSVLTMLENPEDIILKSIDHFEWTYLDRTPYTREKTKKVSYTWPGMQNPSTHWRFSKDFFLDVAKNCEVKFEEDFIVTIRKN